MSDPTDSRYRRLTGLMASNDLDTAHPPDTPYQSPVGEIRSPPDIVVRPFPRFVWQRRRTRRTRHLPRNNQACTSLIARCTSSSPTSLTRVVGCAGTACISCYRLRVACGNRCFAGVDRSMLCYTLLNKRLLGIGKMSHRRRNEGDHRSPSPESSSSSSDFHGGNLPPPDVLRKPPIHMWTHGSSQTDPVDTLGVTVAWGYPTAVIVLSRAGQC